MIPLSPWQGFAEVDGGVHCLESLAMVKSIWRPRMDWVSPRSILPNIGWYDPIDQHIETVGETVGVQNRQLPSGLVEAGHAERRHEDGDVGHFDRAQRPHRPRLGKIDQNDVVKLGREGQHLVDGMDRQRVQWGDVDGRGDDVQSGRMPPRDRRQKLPVQPGAGSDNVEESEVGTRSR